MVAFCLFLLCSLLLFVFLFLVFFVLIFCVFVSLFSSFLAMMSFDGYLLVRFLLSAFFRSPLSFFFERVPGSIWFDTVYLVTAAGFHLNVLTYFSR